MAPIAAACSILHQRNRSRLVNSVNRGTGVFLSLRCALTQPLLPKPRPILLSSGNPAATMPPWKTKSTNHRARCCRVAVEERGATLSGSRRSFLHVSVILLSDWPACPVCRQQRRRLSAHWTALSTSRVQVMINPAHFCLALQPDSGH